jgi:putative heme iron utilization protein
MENDMNDRPFIDLRDSDDDALALIVNNTEELYNLRSNPQALMTVLADDYKFTWKQLFYALPINLERLNAAEAERIWNE